MVRRSFLQITRILTKRHLSCSDGECFAVGPDNECHNVCKGRDNDPWQEPEKCYGTWTKTRGYDVAPPVDTNAHP